MRPDERVAAVLKTPGGSACLRAAALNVTRDSQTEGAQSSDWDQFDQFNDWDKGSAWEEVSAPDYGIS